MMKLVVPETKRPATVDELFNLIGSHKNEDSIVLTGDLSLKEDKLLINGEPYAVRQSGLRGLLNHIKMPYSYASNIPTDLFYDSVNRLCKTYGDFEIMVRTQDKEVRAILSPNYIPLDSYDLVARLKQRPSGLKPARINYDGDNLTVQLVTEAEVSAQKVGDVSKVGVSLETSDINLYPLSANAYLFRLICTNGAILPSTLGGGVSFMQKNVNPETVWGMFDEGYQRILEKMAQIDNAFLIRLENKKVDASNFIKVKNKLTEFAGGRKINDVLRKMEEDVLERGSEVSVYDIYNTVTESARDSVSLYAAQNLEKAAGELLMEFGTVKN
jgi:hypothetical protein